MENQNQSPVQNQYQNPNYTTNYVPQKNQSVVTIGDWIITFLLTAIPLVGFIMLFVWAFGNNTAESKANWAKAALIWYLISIVLVFLFWGSIMAMIVGTAALSR